jgi:hypothetical protein
MKSSFEVDKFLKIVKNNTLPFGSRGIHGILIELFYKNGKRSCEWNTSHSGSRNGAVICSEVNASILTV